MKKIAIVQSNYIPWKGYFDLIAASDEFILYDDMQYTRRDWRNRNQIKTPQGMQWLTVPVLTKGNYHQKICETEIDGTSWAAVHWKALTLNYCRAPYFKEVSEWLEPLYLNQSFRRLSVLNHHFIVGINSYLSINTIIKNSGDYHAISPEKSERLAELCQLAGGTEYISGPSAKDYLNENKFSNIGIKLTWFNYHDYPMYPQLWGEFTHNVSILDLLFNCGKNAVNFMRHGT